MIYKENPEQKWLFDPYAECLGDKSLKKLQSSWAGIFRSVILTLMPVNNIEEEFSDKSGRPTKELYAMCGLILIQEFFNWTNEETSNNYMWNMQVQYALNLDFHHCEMTSRTIERYRKIFRENELAIDVMKSIIVKLVDKLNVTVTEQRLDSTHILSNMSLWGKTKFFREINRRFLVQFKRHENTAYHQISLEFRERYLPEKGWDFGFGSKTKTKKEAIAVYVKDLYFLLSLENKYARISTWNSFKDLKQAFDERCEVINDEVKFKEKISTKIMQNPSDKDATFSGHKGVGYQVQVIETCSEKNDVQFIVGALSQTASDHDSNSLLPMVEQVIENNAHPDLLLADSAYGADNNIQICKTKNTELLSPVYGKNANKKYSIGDFEIGEDFIVKSCPCGNVPHLTNHNKEKGIYRASWYNTVCENCTFLSDCPVYKAKNRYILKYKDKDFRLSARRQEMQTEKFQKSYRKRSGIEGLFRRLDLLSSFKKLKVRGKKAVDMSVYLKISMYNVYQWAKV